MIATLTLNLLSSPLKSLSLATPIFYEEEEKKDLGLLEKHYI